jgi:ribosomal protein L29
MKAEDMDKKLSELRLELSKELGSVKMGRAVKNPGKIKQFKKAIARIQTVKRELKLKTKTETKIKTKTKSKTKNREVK